MKKNNRFLCVCVDLNVKKHIIAPSIKRILWDGMKEFSFKQDLKKIIDYRCFMKIHFHPNIRTFFSYFLFA